MLKLRYPLILTFILISTISLSSCKNSKKEELKSDDKMKVEISADRDTYKIGDDIKLKLRLSNTSKENIELPVTQIVPFSQFIKVGCINGGDVTYLPASIAYDYNRPYSDALSLVAINAKDTLEVTIVLKINPIVRLTLVPYSTSRIFVEIKFKKEDYPKDIQSFFNTVPGFYKSNEVKINIDKDIHNIKSSQYSDIDYSVNFYRLRADNTDQFITRTFRFNMNDALSIDVLPEVNKYVKVFWRGKRIVFFEFYKENKLMAYAQLLYNEKGDYSDFIMYHRDGLIDIRYEALRVDDKTIRWDKYIVNYLTDTDIFLGYIKVTLNKDNIPYITELLMETGKDKFKLFHYNDEGRLLGREESPPPPGTQMRKRKF